MNTSSSLDDELVALSSVVKALNPLSESAREWVLSSAASRFEIATIKVSGSEPQAEVKKAEVQPEEVDGQGYSSTPKVQKWIREAGFTQEQLESVFYTSGNGIQIIASDVPGSSKKTKTINAYILVGAAKFLETGEAKFSDSEAREFCETIGCYDLTNHSKNIKDVGNTLTGSKSVGWTLTMPGLKNAAQIVKDSQ